MVFCFFFFKQKTAYERLSSGWSSDVCSSDLLVVNLVLQLLARELHLFGVDHDDIVTAIDMRGEARLMLAAQDAGDDRCGAADDQSFGVNEKPFLFHSRGRRRLRGFHQRLHGPNLLMGSFPDGENKRTPPKPGQRNGGLMNANRC